MSTDAPTTEAPTQAPNTEIPVTRLHECSDGKKRNDEEYAAWKNGEEAAELKRQQFKKDPDQFIHLDDIVIGLISCDKGEAIVFGKYNLLETQAALVKIQRRLFNALNEFDLQQAMKKRGIITPDKPGEIIT